MNKYVNMAEQLHSIGIESVFLQDFKRDSSGKKTVKFAKGIPWKQNMSIKEQLKVVPNPGGIALRTGKDSNITCIDIDDLESFGEIDDRFNLLQHAKMIVETYNGLHLYYDYNPELTQTQQAGLKIDIRSDGGLLFFPPTQSYTFNEYEGDGIIPQEFIDWFNEQKSSSGVEKTGTSPEHIIDEKEASDKSYLETTYGNILKNKCLVNFHLIDGRKSACIGLFQKLWNKGYTQDTVDDMVVYWNEFNHPPLPIVGQWSLDSCKISAEKYWKGDKSKLTKEIFNEEYKNQPTPKTATNPSKRKNIIFQEDDLFQPWHILEAVGYNAYKSLNGRYFIRTISGIDDIILDFSNEKDFKAYLNGNIVHQYKLEVEKLNKKGELYTERLNLNKVDWSYLSNVKTYFAPSRNDIKWVENGLLHLNVYAPKPMLHKKPKPDVELPELLHKFLMNLVGNNERYYKWFINWLACNYQLKTKAEKTVLFISASGVGKNTLADLITKIYTQDYIHISATTSLLTNIFNAEVKDKLYYFMDEFKIKDDDEYETLKAYTSQNDKFSLTIKGKDTVMYPLTANFILYSNNDIPMRIKELHEDRRFNVFKPEKPLNQYDWWNHKSHSELMNMDDIFAEYLASYPIDIVLRDEQLKTERWKSLIEDSQSPYKQFSDALLKGNLDWFEDTGVLDIKLADGYTLRSQLEKAFTVDGKIESTTTASLFHLIFNEKFKPRLAKNDGFPNQQTVRITFGKESFVKKGYVLFDIPKKEVEEEITPEEVITKVIESKGQKKGNIRIKKTTRLLGGKSW